MRSSSPAVGWAGSAQDAQKQAQGSSEPYALYFCNEETAKIAGEGTAAITQYRLSHKGPTGPQTMWENATFQAAFKEAGISSFAKITLTQANADVIRKYGATDPSLVICAPDGNVIGKFIGSQCTQATIAAFLRTFKQQYAAYQKNKPRG